MFNLRKPWSQQEDELLVKFYRQSLEKQTNQPICWSFFAQRLSQENIGPNRSGKQCRQRWCNFLNPEINKNFKWTSNDKHQLIKLNRKYGNRWSLIAKQLPGRTDNSIKNFVNSTLKKGLRLLNCYICKNRKFKNFQFRNIKLFKQEILTKVLRFSCNQFLLQDFEQKFYFAVNKKSKSQIINQIHEISSDLKQSLMIIDQIFDSKQKQEQNFVIKPEIYNMITNIQKLNAICKKRKQKKENNQEQQVENNQDLEMFSLSKQNCCSSNSLSALKIQEQNIQSQFNSSEYNDKKKNKLNFKKQFKNPQKLHKKHDSDDQIFMTKCKKVGKGIRKEKNQRKIKCQQAQQTQIFKIKIQQKYTSNKFKLKPSQPILHQQIKSKVSTSPQCLEPKTQNTEKQSKLFENELDKLTMEQQSEYCDQQFSYQNKQSFNFDHDHQNAVENICFNRFHEQSQHHFQMPFIPIYQKNSLIQQFMCIISEGNLSSEMSQNQCVLN